MIDLIKNIFSESITIIVGAFVLIVTILFALISICLGGIGSRLPRKG